MTLRDDRQQHPWAFALACVFCFLICFLAAAALLLTVWPAAAGAHRVNPDSTSEAARKASRAVRRKCDRIGGSFPSHFGFTILPRPHSWRIGGMCTVRIDGQDHRWPLKGHVSGHSGRVRITAPEG